MKELALALIFIIGFVIVVVVGIFAGLSLFLAVIS